MDSDQVLQLLDQPTNVKLVHEIHSFLGKDHPELLFEAFFTLFKQNKELLMHFLRESKNMKEKEKKNNSMGVAMGYLIQVACDHQERIKPLIDRCLSEEEMWQEQNEYLETLLLTIEAKFNGGVARTRNPKYRPEQKIKVAEAEPDDFGDRSP